MKKSLLSLLFIAVCGGASAQVSFGPEVGGVFSNYTGQDKGTTVSTKPKLGLRIGGLADISVGKHFALQPGVVYVMNGFKQDILFSSATATIHTIEIPLNVVYKTSDAGDDRVFVGLGPYLAFNMSGSGKIVGNGSSNTFDFNVGNDAYNDNIKRTDVGVGAFAGFQMASGLFFRGHFQQGLVNLQPGGDANNSIFNYNFGLSVGYLFGGKAKKGGM